MYLMYVDESGDSGLLPMSPTRFFALSGLVVHELKWKDLYEELLNFRRFLRDNFGLKLREEFHSAALMRHPGKIKRIEKHNRLAMIRLFASKLSQLPYLSLINVVVDKSDKTEGYDVFTTAWEH